MLERLLELGPGYGYHPESSKSIGVVVRHNLERATVYFSDLAFKVQTGSRYLGGFVREDEDRDEWLESKVATWVNVIKQLSTVVGPYPQSAYVGMQKFVQAGWTFVQRVVQGVGEKCGTIREAMRRSFLPSLLKETLPGNDPIHRLAALPVKSAGLALKDPIESDDENFRASKVTNSHIMQVMRGKEIFSLQNHRATTSKVKEEIKKQKEAVHKSALAAILNPLPVSLSRAIMRGAETGTWLTVLPLIIAGTELSLDEFCDSLHIRYCCTPAGLQPTCDGCGASSNTRHDFSFAKGGLVISRHNKLHDKLCDMASRAFQPSAVRDEPKIHKWRPVQAGQPCRPMAESEDRVDILIRGLWESGTDCKLNVRATDTDTPNCQMKDPSKVLEVAERLKKEKYLQPCLDQRRHLTPFIVSVDGLIGKEAKTV
jgi:hypothetical protein